MFEFVSPDCRCAFRQEFSTVRLVKLLNTYVFTFYVRFANLLGLVLEIHSKSESHQRDYSR